MSIRSVTYPKERRKARAPKLLRAVGLGHRIDLGPLNISSGERQRLAIARAPASDRRIISADMPTGSLDLKSSDEVMGTLNRLNREGRTIIMVIHNREMAESCSRVIRLRDERILEKA